LTNDLRGDMKRHLSVELCPYAAKYLSCFRNNCPISDKVFLNLVRTFLFHPRMKSISWDIIAGSGSVQLFITDVYKILPDKSKRLYKIVEFFYDFFRQDRASDNKMTEQICKDLEKTYEKFNDLIR